MQFLCSVGSLAKLNKEISQRPDSSFPVTASRPQRPDHIVQVVQDRNVCHFRMADACAILPGVGDACARFGMAWMHGRVFAHEMHGPAGWRRCLRLLFENTDARGSLFRTAACELLFYDRYARAGFEDGDVRAGVWMHPPAQSGWRALRTRPRAPQV